MDGQPTGDMRLAPYVPGDRTVATAVNDQLGAYRFDRVKASQYVLASATSTGRTVALPLESTTVDLVMG